MCDTVNMLTRVGRYGLTIETDFFTPNSIYDLNQLFFLLKNELQITKKWSKALQLF